LIMASADARFAFGRGSEEETHETHKLYGEYEPAVIRNMLKYRPPVDGTNIAKRFPMSAKSIGMAIW